MLEFQIVTSKILFWYHANILTYGANKELEEKRKEIKVRIEHYYILNFRLCAHLKWYNFDIIIYE